ncbi:hypothetical protein [Pleurocapsa sp. CCALA 161]|nr:hypothetical protein [Pleurocapsa sp. CCALA 161]
MATKPKTPTATKMQEHRTGTAGARTVDIHDFYRNISKQKGFKT